MCTFSNIYAKSIVVAAYDSNKKYYFTNTIYIKNKR